LALQHSVYSLSNSYVCVCVFSYPLSLPRGRDPVLSIVSWHKAKTNVFSWMRRRNWCAVLVFHAKGQSQIIIYIISKENQERW
jgi:hypothetical protein